MVLARNRLCLPYLDPLSRPVFQGCSKRWMVFWIRAKKDFTARSLGFHGELLNGRAVDFESPVSRAMFANSIKIVHKSSPVSALTVVNGESAQFPLNYRGSLSVETGLIKSSEIRDYSIELRPEIGQRCSATVRKGFAASRVACYNRKHSSPAHERASLLHIIPLYRSIIGLRPVIDKAVQVIRKYSSRNQNNFYFQRCRISNE